jgi:hypothetical protein
MNNRNAFAAHLQEQGVGSCSIYERSACLNSKTTEIYTCGVAHKTAKSSGPIIGLMKNRTEKNQPQVPKQNFCSALMQN